MPLRDYAPAIDARIQAGDGGMLLWTRIGRVRAELRHDPHGSRAPDGIRLGEGEALWLPPGRTAAVHSAPGAVVLPISASATRTAPAVPVRLAVPRAWQPALLSAFAHGLGFLDENAGPDPVALLLAGSAPARGVSPPPVPSSAPTRALAQAATDHPATRPEIAAHAELAGISVRTLERRFYTETGMNWRRWHARSRISLAAELVREDLPLSEIASQCGFSGSSTLIRAFRETLGTTPKRFRTAERNPSAPGEPPPIPASSTRLRVNPFHVAVWAARGSGRIQVAATTRGLRTGEVAVLPAHVPHRLAVDADSVILPVVSVPTDGQDDIDGLLVAVPGERLRTVLLHATVSEYTALQAPGFDEDAVFGGILEIAEPQGMPRTTPPAETARWSALTLASDLLRGGMSVSDVAVRCGYAQASSFSRAFSRALGESPHAFRRRTRGIVTPSTTRRPS